MESGPVNLSPFCPLFPSLFCSDSQSLSSPIATSVGARRCTAIPINDIAVVAFLWSFDSHAVVRV